MAHLLFVCTGNICRSAFAEYYARSLAAPAGASWTFASAGTGALVGAGMDPPMLEVAQRRGLDPAAFVSRQLEGPLVSEADLIVPMEKYHREFILDDHPGLVRKVFTLGQLDRLIQEQPSELRGTALREEIGRHRHRARSREDIADPYRRGAAAMETAAEQIAAALDRVLPRLF